MGQPPPLLHPSPPPAPCGLQAPDTRAAHGPYRRARQPSAAASSAAGGWQEGSGKGGTKKRKQGGVLAGEGPGELASAPPPPLLVPPRKWPGPRHLDSDLLGRRRRERKRGRTAVATCSEQVWKKSHLEPRDTCAVVAKEGKGISGRSGALRDRPEITTPPPSFLSLSPSPLSLSARARFWLSTPLSPPPGFELRKKWVTPDSPIPGHLARRERVSRPAWVIQKLSDPNRGERQEEERKGIAVREHPLEVGESNIANGRA